MVHAGLKRIEEEAKMASAQPLQMLSCLCAFIFSPKGAARGETEPESDQKTFPWKAKPGI